MKKIIILILVLLFFYHGMIIKAQQVARVREHKDVPYFVMFLNPSYVLHVD